MPPVFAHGRLRLYLLKLLDETPRHGYELIRLLEERFQGLYAPSAGTVYPRLAKLEAEGLIEHVTEGGRKVYSITTAGLAELADRQGELADLELEIHESLTALAEEIREDVRDSASELRREVFEATRNVAAPQADGSAGSGATEDTGARSSWPDQESWQRAKDELMQAKRELQRQARRARDESRRARQQAKAAEEEADRAHRKARQEAHQEAREAAEEEVRRIARTVQDQVQERAKTGDWQGAVREGMAELAKEMGTLGRITGQATAWPPFGAGWSSKTYRGRSDGTSSDEGAPGGTAADADGSAAAEAPQPEWATEPLREDEEPARALERLLDRFRDDVRDASRDHGVTRDQLHEIRRELSGAAVHIGSVLRPKD